MKDHRECIIEGCTHVVQPQNEVDVSVGVISSIEIPICDECYESKDPEIIKQIEEVLEKDGKGSDGLPF